MINWPGKTDYYARAKEVRDNIFPKDAWDVFNQNRGLYKGE